MSYFLADWPFFDYQTMPGGRYRLLNVCLIIGYWLCIRDYFSCWKWGLHRQ